MEKFVHVDTLGRGSSLMTFAALIIAASHSACARATHTDEALTHASLLSAYFALAVHCAPGCSKISHAWSFLGEDCSIGAFLREAGGFVRITAEILYSTRVC